MDIYEKQELRMKNVLAYRTVLSQNEIMTVAKELESFIDDSGAKIKAPIITATYSVEQIGSKQVMDMEFLAVLDTNLTSYLVNCDSILKGKTIKKECFRMISDFYLTNAIQVHYSGKTSDLFLVSQKLNEYIQLGEHVPITPVYNVSRNQSMQQVDFENVDVDIYVGLSPNKV